MQQLAHQTLNWSPSAQTLQCSTCLSSTQRICNSVVVVNESCRVTQLGILVTKDVPINWLQSALVVLPIIGVGRLASDNNRYRPIIGAGRLSVDADYYLFIFRLDY